VIHLAVASPVVDVGRSVREGAYMFWETLWALVLGFSLAGLVQAFVSKEQMQAKLGNHGPAVVGRAAGYGMVSSSCSYAASAMAKSLFAKGADLVAALIFMIASTNLVVELGIVMLVLLGWQFMVAEFVGGPLMIALVALAGGFVLRGPLVGVARRRLEGPPTGAQDHAPGSEAPTGTTWTAKLRSPAALSDAAGYAVADVTMLRRELVVGYSVAGFLAVLVPTGTWDALFVSGHGFWTVLENALVGPLIAVVSFVCSIGNVPLAAALWSGGISFGGVISFIFADLIAMPLILIYRKYYGSRLALLDPGDLRAHRRDPDDADDSRAIHPVRLELHHLSRHRLPRLRRRGVVAGSQQGAFRRRARLRPRSGVRHAGASGRRAGVGIIRGRALPVLLGSVPGAVPR
jgi:hypothetical protein